MENAEMIAKIQELQELKRMKDELDDAIASAQDAIKAALGDTEAGAYGPFRVTYKEVTSVRVDTSALKRELPDVAARYSKTYVTRPLRIS